MAACSGPEVAATNRTLVVPTCPAAALAAAIPTRSMHKAAKPVASAMTAWLDRGRRSPSGTRMEPRGTAAGQSAYLPRSAAVGIGAPLCRTGVVMGRLCGPGGGTAQVAGTGVSSRQHADAAAGHVQESAVTGSRYRETDRRIVKVEAVLGCRHGCHDGLPLDVISLSVIAHIHAAA